MQKLFMTTDASSLYYRLQKKLYDHQAAFRQIILVPHEFIAQKIYDHLASEGIGTGFKVFELGAGIDYIIRLGRGEEKKGKSFPAPMLFSLHLQHLIEQNLDEPVFKPLLDYLDLPTSTPLREKRLQEVSDALSIDFLHYGVYGAEGLKQWLKKYSWQGVLFKKAFETWDYPALAFEHLSKSIRNGFEMEIHLFGFSFIPKVYDSFFEKIGRAFKVHHYFLTPCQHYWGDCLSSDKAKYLAAKFYEKEVNEGEIEMFKTLAKNDNPFLSNYAKASQRRYNFLLENSFEREEFFYEEKEALTLLEKIKKFIFNGEAEFSCQIESKDKSFQIHKCTSKRREIEALADILMDLTVDGKINPKEILVLAPNISDYLPYIKDVFTNQTPFPFQVNGLELKSQSAFLDAFLSLVSIYQTRFEKKEILSLLTFNLIRKKFQLDEQEFKTAKAIIEKLPVEFGYNLAHKNRIFNKFDQKLEEEEGTWYYALKKALYGLCIHVGVDSDESAWDFFPLQIVNNDEAEILGSISEFLQLLWSYDSLFFDSKKTLSEWIKLFQGFVALFFDEPLCMEDEGYHFFLKQLKTLEQLSVKIPSALFSFSHLVHLFEKTFSKKSAQIRHKNKNAIMFATLCSQMFYPVDIIVYLGMDEESFPQKQPTYPLREIPAALMDPYPLLIEEQKQMVFDGIMYAKKALIISYSSVDESDGKQKQISYFFKEWLDYLQPGFKNPITDLIFEHKGFGFHEKTLACGSYLLSNFELAKAYYSPKKDKRDFIPEFYQKKSFETLLKMSEKITLTQLSNFSRNPFRFYMKDSLGVQIKKEDLEDEKQREFSLSHLDKALLLKNLLLQTKNRSWELQDLQGGLPRGIFKTIAHDLYQEQKEELIAACQDLHIDFEQIKTLELNTLCNTPFWASSHHLIVPALSIEYNESQKISIEGKIEGITKEGLLLFSKKSFVEDIRAWPTYLVYLLTIRTYKIELFGEPLIFIKEKHKKSPPSSDLKEALSGYLKFFQSQSLEPSFLFPSWIEAFLLNTKEEKEEFIKKTFSQRQEKVFADDYENWFLDNIDPLSYEFVDPLVKDLLSETFHPLLKWNKEQDQNA